MKNFALASLLWFTVFSAVESGQNSSDTRAAQASALLKPASVEVPKGEGAWAVRVMQMGGVAGQSVDIAVTSVGDLKCLPAGDASCAKVNSGEVLKSVASLIDPKLLRKSKSALGDSCRDCIVTSITIGTRDEKGKIDTYFAYWDDLTAAKAPFQLVRIATTMVGTLKK